MTANTDYKITKIGSYDTGDKVIGGEEIFNFSSTSLNATVNWLPSNINQNVGILGETFPMPFRNLSAHNTTGLGARNIVVQGTLRDDSYSTSNKWTLSAAVHDRRAKKFYFDEDWYCYVVGHDLVWTRDEDTGLLNRYTVSLMAYDPTIYYAGGMGDGSLTTTPHTLPSSSSISGEGSGTIDLRDVTLDSGDAGIANRWYVTPFFWVVAGSTSNVSTSESIIITDAEGRTVSFTPDQAFVDGEAWVVCPYTFRHKYDGFGVDNSVAYRVSNNYDSDWPSKLWFLDVDPYDGNVVDLDGVEPQKVNATTGLSASTGLKKRTRSPQAIPEVLDDINLTAGVCSFTVASDGDMGNSTTYIQWTRTRI